MNEKGCSPSPASVLSEGDVFAGTKTMRERLFAFLRIGGFLVLTAMFSVGFSMLLSMTAGMPGDPSIQLGVGDFVVFFAIVLATFCMSKLKGPRFESCGLGNWKKNGVRLFLIGLVAGIAVLALQLCLMWASGCLTFSGVSAPPVTLLRWGVFYLLVFAGVALCEETLFRGFLLVELSRAITFWPAVVVLAILFGGVHILNGGSENVFGIFVAAAFGGLFAVSFRLTGSLWWAIGVHMGWDYAQSYLFGVANSGMHFQGQLFHAIAYGPDWLTGSAVGPEGSVLVLVSLALFVCLLIFGKPLWRKG